MVKVKCWPRMVSGHMTLKSRGDRKRSICTSIEASWLAECKHTLHGCVEGGKVGENTGVLGENLCFPVFSQRMNMAKTSVSPYLASASFPRRKCLISRKFSPISPYKWLGLSVFLQADCSASPYGEFYTLLVEVPLPGFLDSSKEMRCFQYLIWYQRLPLRFQKICYFLEDYAYFSIVMSHHFG